MVGEEPEICGFLDVKLLGNRSAQKVKKRSLAPWKVWKRHWCSVKKLGPGLGVEVQFDCGISSNDSVALHERENSIMVPLNSLVYRTQSRSKQFAFGIFLAKERKPLLYLSGNSETETQRWMANIRELLRPRRHRFIEGTYSISMVDNAHSKLSGLTGLYGDLVASRIGVFIKDIHSGEIVENLEWKELDQFHLTAAGRPEDVKRICVIHTTKEFRGGVGELHIFCLDASKLLQDLVTQGRGPKHKHINQRPLSLSEGDLRLSMYCDETARNFPVLKSKIASSLLSAGLGLLLSSRSGSEVKALNDITETAVLNKMTNFKTSRAIENVYQPEPASISNINIISENFDDPSQRRVSDVSIASGIYEEILDDVDTPKPVSIHSDLYEDTDKLVLSLQLEPPPLPPRQKSGSELKHGSTKMNSASMTPNAEKDVAIPHDDNDQQAMDHSNYVPMSPRLKDITLYQLQGQKPPQEEDYVVMR